MPRPLHGLLSQALHHHVILSLTAAAMHVTNDIKISLMFTIAEAHKLNTKRLGKLLQLVL